MLQSNGSLLFSAYGMCVVIITSVRLYYYHGVAIYDNNKLVLTYYSIGYLYFLQDMCIQWNILH